MSQKLIQKLHRKALNYHYKDQYRKSRRWFNKALKIDPNNPDVLANKGKLFHKFGKLQRALKYFNLALIYNPNLKRAIRGREVALTQMRRRSKKIKRKIKDFLIFGLILIIFFAAGIVLYFCVLFFL